MKAKRGLGDVGLPVTAAAVERTAVLRQQMAGRVGRMRGQFT